MNAILRRMLAVLMVLILMSTDLCAVAEAVAELNLPSALQIIDEEAFYGNTAIEKVIVPDGATEIRSKAFGDSSMTELVLPDTLTFIADDAFEGCGEVKVTVPEDSYAYNRCIELGLIKASEMESAHPYLDGFDYTWTYDAGEDTENITVTFSDKTETEPDFDIIYIYTLSDVQVGKYSGKELAGQSITIEDSGFKLRLTSDEAWDGENTYYGFKVTDITAKKIVPLVFGSITAENSTVIAGTPIRWTVETTGGKLPVFYDYTVLKGESEVASGTVEAPNIIEYTPMCTGEYKLSVIARDSSAAVLDAQVSEAVTAAPTPEYPETPHHYHPRWDHTWLYAAEENVQSMTVTFSEKCKIESRDRVYLYDQNGIEIRSYGGNELAGHTIEIMGNAFTIRLVNKDALCDYGFSITSIEKYVPDTLRFVSLTADKAKAKVGEAVSWTMNTEGGNLPVMYDYTITLDDVTKYAGSARRPDKISFVPAEAGDYTVSVVTRDAEGNTLEAQTSKVRVAAQDETPAEYFTYTSIGGDKISITGYTGEDTNVIIPETIDGYVVKEIANKAFQHNAALVSVSIPATVAQIGEYAFANCDALQGVRMEEGLTTVLGRAFEDCDELRSIVFPDSVTTFGNRVLRHNDRLSFVHFPAGWTTSGVETVIDCPRLTHIELPEGMKAVPANAFRDCRHIEEVVFPSTLESIGGFAFAGCYRLRNINLPSEMESIGNDAFKHCRSLTKIELPRKLRTIYGYAFDGCTGLQDVVFNDELKSIYVAAFAGCTSLVDADLPDSVTEIGELCFSNCSALESFHFPLNWTKVLSRHNNGALYGGNIFSGCTKLTSYTIPEGITAIPASAFEGFTELKEIHFPSTLETIGSSAFAGCTGLTVVELPENLKTLRLNVFRNCANLKDVIFNEGLESVQAGCFAFCVDLKEADLPDSVKEIGELCFENCTSLEVFDYPLSWERVTSRYDNGSRYGGGTFYNCEKLPSIVIPEGVTFIPDGAFEAANKLTEIHLPSTLETIGNDGFRNCPGLTVVELPKNLKTLRLNVFRDCANLKEVIFNEVLESVQAGCFAYCADLVEADLPDSVKEIGELCFEGCISLESFHYPLSLERLTSRYDNGHLYGGGTFYKCEKLTSVVVPEGITFIPAALFQEANYLQSVSLPSTLETIWNTAFAGCIRLPQIYISPAVTHIADNAFDNCPELTIWTEYGAYALQHAIKRKIPYYYLTPDGANPPSGTLYEGEYYGLYGYARSSLPLTNVTATIWNSDKSAVIQTISVAPGVTDYPLSGAINNHLMFHELPLGHYRYTMTASTELSAETWADTAFKIVEQPLWIGISNFTVPTDVVDSETGSLQISGRLYANYTMTSVMVELIGADGVIVASASAVPNSKSFELSNLWLNILGVANGAYTLQIHASAKGETQCVARYTFSIGNGVNITPVTDELRSEVLEYLKNRKGGTFNPGARVDEYFGNLDVKDYIQMGLSDYTNIGLTKIGDWLTGSEYDTYMKTKYETEIAQLLDDMYKTGQVLTFPLDTGITEMLKSFTDIRDNAEDTTCAGIAREIVVFAAKYNHSIPRETYMMLEQISTEIETMGVILEGVKVAEDVFDVLRDLLTDHSRALEALDVIAEIHNQSGDPNFTAALQTLRRNYQTQYGQALHTAFGKITEELRSNAGKMLTKALLSKSVSGLYGLVDTVCQLIFKLIGVEKMGQGKYQFVTQYTTLLTLQQTFSNACTDAMMDYYENGILPTDRQIGKIQLTFVSARQALIRLYQTMSIVDAGHKLDYERLINQAENIIMPGVPRAL